MIKKLYHKFTALFFTRSFITFCIIGCLNTAIHFGVYKLLFLRVHVIIANTVAFICASIFSYCANAKFTFKEKMASKTFMYSMIIFFARLLLSNLLTYLVDLFFIEIELLKLRSLAPIIASVMLIPFQFIFLKLIFKKQIFESDHETK